MKRNIFKEEELFDFYRHFEPELERNDIQMGEFTISKTNR